MKSQVKRINPVEFERTYGLMPNSFHRAIKPIILQKVKPQAHLVGKNPDIMLDRQGNIAYQGAKGHGFQDTGLNIIEIFKELR